MLLATLAQMGADAILLAAALLFDVDSELGVAWEDLRPRILSVQPLGPAVTAIVDEKRELGQVAQLFFLRALMSQEEQETGLAKGAWPAVSQLLRQLSVQAAGDYRAVLLEVTSVALSLGERAVDAELTPGRAPSAATRALARTALELHAPLTHALGFDALAKSSSSGVLPLPNCWTLTGALEHLGLWMVYPGEYRVVVDWFDRQHDLLQRELERGIDIVQMALDSCRHFGRLTASYATRGRVKTPHSVMKKLLRGQRIKDLLGMEIVIVPSEESKGLTVDVTINDKDKGWTPKTTVSGEAACCFAAAAAITRFTSNGELGWYVTPRSVKDYITKPKKSGYQAIHMALITDMLAPAMRPEGEGLGQTQVLQRAPCELEVHIFSESMKWEERHGHASHASFKAFPMRPKAIFEALDEESGDIEGTISIDAIAHDAFLDTGNAEQTLHELAEKAGYEDGEHIVLEDLEASREEVDEVVAWFHGAAAGKADAHVMDNPPELTHHAAHHPRPLALPEPRPEPRSARDGDEPDGEQQGNEPLATSDLPAEMASVDFPKD